MWIAKLKSHMVPLLPHSYGKTTLLSRIITPPIFRLLVLLMLSLNCWPLYSQSAAFIHSSGVPLTSVNELISGPIFFPKIARNNSVTAVVYQEVDRIDSVSGRIYLSAVLQSQTTTRFIRFAGPIDYSREDPPEIFSAAIDNNDNVYVAVAPAQNTIQILRLARNAAQFEPLTTLNTEVASVAPKIFIRPNNEIIIFVNNREINSNNQGIQYTISADGRSWTNLRSLVSNTPLGNNFLPIYLANTERELVIFQNLNPNQSNTHQIYLTTSNNSARTWTNPVHLTRFVLSDEEEAALNYSNQRASALLHNNTLHITWERRYPNSPSRVLYAHYNLLGQIIDQPVQISGTNNASYPHLQSYQNRLLISWREQRGDRLLINLSVFRTDANWVTEEIFSANSINPIYDTQPQALLPIIYWVQGNNPRTRAIQYRTIDLDAQLLVARGTNFNINAPGNQSAIQVAWESRQNTNSIAGYSYTWSQDPQKPPPNEANLPRFQQSISLLANQEGLWYYKMASFDNFGKILDTTEFQYTYDPVPPPPVSIKTLPTDEDGNALSNTVVLRWEPENVSEVAEYEVSFAPQLSTSPVNVQRISDPLYAVDNIDNGVWELSVAAIDAAGNASSRRTALFRFNKYRPLTLIYSVENIINPQGQQVLQINGKGFTSEGVITQCIFDTNAATPYDVVFNSSTGSCQPTDDTIITNVPLGSITSGQYFVGLVHERRGVTFSVEPFELLASGTVIFGDFRTSYTPSFSIAPQSPLSARLTSRIAIVPLILLLVLLNVFLIIRVRRVIADSREYRNSLRVLENNVQLGYTSIMSRNATLKRQGYGLRIKFIFFITLLIMSTVAIISLVLGSISLNRLERTLSSGLQQRIHVLLDSISTQAGAIIIDPVNLTLQLQPLTAQSDILSEARYITITSRGRNNPNATNYVWVSNDPNILNANTPESTSENTQNNVSIARIIDTPTLEPGISIITDPVTPLIPQIDSAITQEAQVLVGTLPSDINALNQEVVALITSQTNNVDRIAQIDSSLAQLRGQLEERLRTLKSEVLSFPQYDPDRLSRTQTEYIFYQPIVAWDNSEVANYYQGMVRLGLSTESQLQELRAARRTIIITSLIITAITIILGIIGATILGAVVVAPILKIVDGVETIHNTEDKSLLKDHTINVRSHDELSLLARSLNIMTHGLAQAAEANKELIVGKEIQKLFIPLATDSKGRKLSIAHEKFSGLECAGYYEGAHGVSGDYFSFYLFDDYLAIIKCDVSGKGVPAALIMVEVATVFTDYVRSSSGAHASTSGALSNLAARINDILEGMKFEGRFAALSILVINQKSGMVRVVNAGDSQLHIYRAAKNAVEIMDLPKSPAAGVFASDMMPNGFQETQTTLAPNDFILLFTDGLDESRRLLRDASLKPHTLSKDELTTLNSQYHDTLKEDSEEFGLYRIHDIIKAITQRLSYTLKKVTPADDLSPELQFDFSSLEPTTLNVLLSLVSIEKIFRLHLPPSSLLADQETDVISIDKVLLSFLSHSFNQFNSWFAHMVAEETQEETAYSRVKGLFEEEQYDDITCLIVKKV